MEGLITNRGLKSVEHGIVPGTVRTFCGLFVDHLDKNHVLKPNCGFEEVTCGNCVRTKAYEQEVVSSIGLVKPTPSPTDDDTLEGIKKDQEATAYEIGHRLASILVQFGKMPEVKIDISFTIVEK